MSRGEDFSDRPVSEQLCDLHVFVVPPELWRDHLKSAVNQIINDTVSAGFLRVHPETKVYSLRDEIDAQLGYDVIPKEFVFLRSVGRALTRLKPKQEHMLKVKSFLPPQAYSPEIYVLEATPEVRNIPYSGTSSEYSAADSNRYHGNQYPGNHPGNHGNNGYDPYDSGRSSDVMNQKPVVPPIRSGNNTASTQTDDEEASHQYDRYPLTPSTLTNSATQTGTNTPVPTPRTQTPYTQPSRNQTPHTNHTPRNRTPGSQTPYRGQWYGTATVPPIRQTPPQDVIPPPREDPTRHDPHGGTPTQEEDQTQPQDQHSAPGRRSPPVVPHWTPTPKPRTPHSRGDPHLTNPADVNGTGDSPLPPLSASPPPGSAPRSPQPQERDHRPGSQADEYLPPVSATPTHSPDPRASDSRDLARVLATDQAQPADKQTSEDSGISEGAEDRERRKLEELLRKEREEDERRRAQAQIEDAERRRREWEEEEERRRQEGDNRDGGTGNRSRSRSRSRSREDEEEERRRREEEEKAERKRQEEERRRQDPDGFRSPPPPPPHEESVDAAAEKARILAELERVREERKEMERKREELVKKAKGLQTKTHHKRNQARDVWKKKYFEEKKKTSPLEEQCNKLRQELDSLHRRIMSTLEGTKENRALGGNKPSQQSNLKIQATKLQHEIEEFQRRVENVKMKLTSEMKLRNQAETELRALRAELTQKKISVTLTRSQQYNAALSGSQDFSSPRNNPAMLTPKS